MAFNSRERYDIQVSKLLDNEKNQTDDQERGITAAKSFKVIMTVVDRHRPFEPSDFVKETFIPNGPCNDRAFIELEKQHGWR